MFFRSFIGRYSDRRRRSVTFPFGRLTGGGQLTNGSLSLDGSACCQHARRVQ